MKNNLPTFLIVGAVKAGTTSLYEYLQQHPEVFMSPIKETNFFSDSEMKFQDFNLDYRQDISVDIEKYLAGPMDKKIHIAHIRSWEQFQKLFRDVQNEKAIGEVSNSYLYLPETAKQIKDKLPQVKIVMILRNPIERLYSQFLMNLRLGKIAENDLLKEIQTDQNKKIKGWGVSHLYLEVGNYASQVKHYLNQFSQDQIKIILFDNFKSNPKEEMKNLFQFIGVDSNFIVNMDQKYNEAGLPRFGKLNYFLTQTGIYTLSKKMIPEKLKQSVKNLVYSRENLPKITQTEKEWLQNYYRQDIEQLSQLIQKDLSQWIS